MLAVPRSHEKVQVGLAIAAVAWTLPSTYHAIAAGVRFAVAVNATVVPDVMTVPPLGRFVGRRSVMVGAAETPGLLTVVSSSCHFDLPPTVHRTSETTRL